MTNIRNAGIGLFAVTDHDSTENLTDAARLAKEYGLGFINGVEINTTIMIGIIISLVWGSILKTVNCNRSSTEIES